MTQVWRPPKEKHNDASNIESMQSVMLYYWVVRRNKEVQLFKDKVYYTGSVLFLTARDALFSAFEALWEKKKSRGKKKKLKWIISWGFSSDCWEPPDFFPVLQSHVSYILIEQPQLVEELQYLPKRLKRKATSVPPLQGFQYFFILFFLS